MSTQLVSNIVNSGLAEITNIVSLWIPNLAPFFIAVGALFAVLGLIVYRGRMRG